MEAPHSSGSAPEQSHTAATVAKLKELPEDQREAYWYEHVLRQDTKQLTVRATIMGMLLGGIMSVSNLYVGLMTGWGFGVTITAGIMAFAIFKVFEKVLPGGHFTDLENNAMQSVSSAAGFMSSAGLVSAIPALLLLNGTRLDGFTLAIWLMAISIMGVFVAIPMKRQMINIDQLPFPSGIAAAETIKSLHGQGEEAMRKAKSLGLGSIIGAVVAYSKDLHEGLINKFFPALKPIAGFHLPGQIPSNPEAYKFGGIGWDKLTLGADMSLLLYAAGAIMGVRTGISLIIGACINWFFIAPWLINNHIVVNGKVVTGGFKGIVGWTTWPGTGMLVVATLVGLGLQWKSVLRGFSGIGDIFNPKGAAAKDEGPGAAVEVPGSWFLIGFGLAAIACILLQYFLFGIKLWMGVLGVILAVVLSMVTCRVTGETDISPTGAMGKMTQLTYAAISPGQPVTNLMTANVTAGAAIHAADLLTDLKSGYILGAKPRQQFWAQLFGVAAGTLFCVPAYNLLVPNPEVLGTKFAAPGALVWKATAEALAKGLDSIPPTALHLMLYTVTFGIIVTLLEAFVPKSRKWLPSPTGLGLALVLPFTNSFAIFLGSVIGWALFRSKPEFADRHVITFSSGLIAGESIMSVIIIGLSVALGL
jgi:uncharacterized oligopeptide transporter (OPT) family protein